MLVFLWFCNQLSRFYFCLLLLCAINVLLAVDPLEHQRYDVTIHVEIVPSLICWLEKYCKSFNLIYPLNHYTFRIWCICLTRLGFIKVMYFVKVFYWVSDIYKGIKSMHYLFIWIACKFSDKHVKVIDFFNLKGGNGMYYLFIMMVKFLYNLWWFVTYVTQHFIYCCK